MIIKSTKNKTFKIAYVIDRERLEKILKTLSETFPDLQISIECSDGMSQNFTSKTTLLEFPNSQERKIISLFISSLLAEKSHIKLTFRSSVSLTPVEYEISGSDKDVSYLSQKLDEHISTLKLWYTPFAFLDFIMGLLIAAFIIYLGIITWGTFILPYSGIETLNKVQESDLKQLVQTVMFLIVIGIFIIGIIFNFFRKFLFPFANFLIGKGKDRFSQVNFGDVHLG